jgi:hypothetical protein
MVTNAYSTYSFKAIIIWLDGSFKQGEIFRINELYCAVEFTRELEQQGIECCRTHNTYLLA